MGILQCRYQLCEQFRQQAKASNRYMAAEQGPEDTQNFYRRTDRGDGKGRGEERELIFVCSKHRFAMAVHTIISEPP